MLTAAHWLILSALEAPRFLRARHGTNEGVATLIYQAGWRINVQAVALGLNHLREEGLARRGEMRAAGGFCAWSITPAGADWLAANMNDALLLLHGQEILTIKPRGRLAA